MNTPNPASSFPRAYQGGFLVGLIFFITTFARALIQNQDSPSLQPSIILLSAFGLLYLLEPQLAQRWPWTRFAYFPLQTFLLIAASYLEPYLDMYNLLYLVLAAQAIRRFRSLASTAWCTAFFVLMSASLILGLGIAEGVALTLFMTAAGVFNISYDQLYERTLRVQVESQALLADLQQAHLKLQEYTAQTAQLAAARERNRLARELHDSVSQHIFSISLNNQAARLLAQRDPGKLAGQLDLLQELTSNALSQLRSLIAELHPPQE